LVWVPAVSERRNPSEDEKLGLSTRAQVVRRMKSDTVTVLVAWLSKVEPGDDAK
jgi:hypothetical protein